MSDNVHESRASIIFVKCTGRDELEYTCLWISTHIQVQCSLCSCATSVVVSELEAARCYRQSHVWSGYFRVEIQSAREVVQRDAEL